MAGDGNLSVNTLLKMESRRWLRGGDRSTDFYHLELK